MGNQYIVGGYTYLMDLFDLIERSNRQAPERSGTRIIPYFKPTVTEDVLVEFDATRRPLAPEDQEEINHIANYMQQTYSGTMRPYKTDEKKAQTAQGHIQNELRTVDPKAEVAVLDIVGNLVAGGASNIRGSEVLLAGAPCYIFGADPLQATVLEGRKEAIYAVKLPVRQDMAMYALAKCAHPELLGPMARAVGTLKLD